MTLFRFRSMVSLLALFTLALIAAAQDNQKPAYLDPSLPPEQRAADLVHRLTVEEKASQLVNQSRAIPRLNIPEYDWAYGYLWGWGLIILTTLIPLGVFRWRKWL